MPVTILDIAVVQKCYPQIYLARHTRHKRAASTEHHLSERDSPLLSHLNVSVPISHGDLATHLGVRPSTLSAAINKLERFGYVERRQEAKDRRVVLLWLTQKGAVARAATSVLDQDRVAAILFRLTREDKTTALATSRRFPTALFHEIPAGVREYLEPLQGDDIMKIAMGLGWHWYFALRWWS